MEGDRNVTRSFGKGFRSEWTVDDQEEETIISTSVADMTGSSEGSYLTYTTSDYVTKEKDNTSLVDEAALAAGNSLNGTISADHGVVSKTGRQYSVYVIFQSRRIVTTKPVTRITVEVTEIIAGRYALAAAVNPVADGATL